MTITMNKIYTLIVAVSALFATSCDDFLDVKPIGKIIPKSYADFRALQTKAYAINFNGRSLATLRSDEVTLDPNSFSYQEYKDIFYWNDGQPDPLTAQFSYQDYYQAIFLANHIINEGSKATEGTADQINQLLGEAYLLRAYTYFTLVNLYAGQYGDQDPTTQKGVPITTSIDLEKVYYPNSVAEVYNQILSDIKAGTELLNIDEQPKGLNYRFSKVSAFGFASRVYLYMKDYTNAVAYAEKALAINSQLQDLNGTNSIAPYNYQSIENVLAFEQTFTLNVSNSTVASNDLIGSYDQANDLRFPIYFTESDGTYKINLGGTSAFKVSLRTSEFYLNIAEALGNTNGKLADAKGYLKQLIAKRLKPQAYTDAASAIDAMDKAAFIKQVFEERKRELACQGFRWFDLRRNGKPAITKDLDGTAVILKENDPRYTIPFPKDAITNNPYLK